MFITEALVNFIVNLLSQGVGYQAKRVRDVLTKVDVRFAVLGNRACGKTTLINRMLGRPIDEDYYGPTVGEDRIGDFEYVGLTETVSVEQFSDFGGDLNYWPLWDEAFTRDRPTGLIFMIDHEDIGQHRKAFTYFVDFISKPDTSWLFLRGKHVRAREQLKVVLFLVNKEDEWADTMRMGQFLHHFSQDFRRLRFLGIPVIQHSCSALTGANVDSALSAFFRRML